MNAAIPAELRLLNLALVDIGAGTTDIAICRDGSVVGYTMATIAGDEITEALMRSFLVDFQTAESLKRKIRPGEAATYTDILGMENTTSYEELCAAIEEPMVRLAEAIAARVMEVNTTAPSALFLAGGGSKLNGLRERVAKSLDMDERRVAIAGNNYAKTAFAEKLNLENPEYATPLGIAVSAGLGLLNDSYVVSLNGEKAKLFRSGSLTLRDILLMNGYTYADMLGRTGRNLSVTLDGRRILLRGEPAVPAILMVNDEEAALTTVVNAGDRITFTPARSGADAARTLGELLDGDFSGRVLVNNQEVPLDTPLRQGDVVFTLERDGAQPAAPALQPQEPSEPADEEAQETEARETPAQTPPPVAAPRSVVIVLNGTPLTLPVKENDQPYYLMDLLERSGLDFDHLEGPVRLTVNGVESGFSQAVRNGDNITIRCN